MNYTNLPSNQHPSTNSFYYVFNTTMQNFNVTGVSHNISSQSRPTYESPQLRQMNDYKVNISNVSNNGVTITNNLVCEDITGSTQLNVNSPLYCQGGIQFITPIGAYVHGFVSRQTIPLFCSMNRASLEDQDYLWILMPGFRIILFRNVGYSSDQWTLDNTNGFTAIRRRSQDIYAGTNVISSFRLFFRNVEIVEAGISSDD